MTNQRRAYAIAVRDGGNLFLWLSIVRDPLSDVYANSARDHIPGWKPHASYHASGQHHQKSHNQKSLVRQKQRPDANFSGAENVLTTNISAEEVRSVNIQCSPQDFQGVYEIPIDDLKPGMAIAVDLTDPASTPVANQSENVVWKECIQDTQPWIHVRVFSNSP